MAILRARRRRRVLAAPFVVTAALSGPGCVIKDSTTPPPTAPGAESPAGQTSATPQNNTGARTMPTGPKGQTEEEPKVVVNPPPPQKELPEAPATGGTVQTRDDGSCWFMANPGPCPEGAICNPPPPRQVKCPADDTAE